MHDNLVQTLQSLFQTLPDPAGENLAGRIFQALYIVEVVMIQLIVKRSKRLFKIGEIHHPAHRRIDLARYVDFDTKRMPMQLRALMPRRHIGQSVRRLDLEYLEYLHDRRPRAETRWRKSDTPTLVAMGGLEPPTPAL